VGQTRVRTGESRNTHPSRYQDDHRVVTSHQVVQELRADARAQILARNRMRGYGLGDDGDFPMRDAPPYSNPADVPLPPIGVHDEF